MRKGGGPGAMPPTSGDSRGKSGELGPVGGKSGNWGQSGENHRYEVRMFSQNIKIYSTKLHLRTLQKKTLPLDPIPISVGGFRSPGDLAPPPLPHLAKPAHATGLYKNPTDSGYARTYLPSFYLGRRYS